MNKLFNYIKEHKPQVYAVCGGIIVIILLLLLCIPQKDNNVDNSNTVTETVTDTANAGPDANNVSTVEKKDEVENKINNENIDVEVVEKKDEVENKTNDKNITTEIVETKNDEDNAENTVVTNTSELKDDNVAEANDDNEVSTSTNNGNVSTSTGGTYPSPPLTSNPCSKRYFTTSSRPFFDAKHIGVWSQSFFDSIFAWHCSARYLTTTGIPLNLG